MRMLRGYVVILSRDGVSGNYCDWRADKCIFGSDPSCDVHIKLPSVAPFHCKLEAMSDGRVFVENLSTSHRTLLNQINVRDRTFVPDEGLLTIADRKFKFIYPECSKWKLKPYQVPPQRSVAFSSPSNSSSKAVRASILPKVNHGSQRSSPISSPRVKTSTLSSQRKGLSTTERYGPTPPRPSPRTPMINVERHSLKRRTSSNSCSPIGRDNVRKKARVNIISETPVLTGTQYIRRLPTPSTVSTNQTNNSSHCFLKSTVCESPNTTGQFDLFTESYATPSTFVTDRSNASFGELAIAAGKPRVSSCNASGRNSGGRPATRKGVQFGPRLSPEQFDSRLPPSTPLKKGDLPPPSSIQRLRSSIVKLSSESKLSPSARTVVSTKGLVTDALCDLRTAELSEKSLVNLEGQSSAPSNASLCGSSIDSCAETLGADSSTSKRSSLRNSRGFALLNPVELSGRTLRSASAGSVYLSSRVAIGGRSRSFDSTVPRVVNADEKFWDISRPPLPSSLSFSKKRTSKFLFGVDALDETPLNVSYTTAVGGSFRGSVPLRHSQTNFGTSSLTKSASVSSATGRGSVPLSSSSSLLPAARKLLKTPKSQIPTGLGDVRHSVMTPETALPRKSPRLADACEQRGTPIVLSSRLSSVRKLANSSKVRLSPGLTGIREMFRSPKSLPSPRLSGVRRLIKTPKIQSSPRLVGIREMLRVPKAAQASPRLTGIRELVRTPRPSLPSPRLSGIKKLVKTPKQETSPVLCGVRELMRTPKQMDSPSLAGIRELMRSPKTRLSPRLSGLKELMDITTPQKRAAKPYLKSTGRTRKFKSAVSVSETSPVFDIESSTTKKPQSVVNVKPKESVGEPFTRITRARTAKICSAVGEVVSPVAAAPAPKKRGTCKVRFEDSIFESAPVHKRRGKRVLASTAKSSPDKVMNCEASELVRLRGRSTKKVVGSKSNASIEVEEPMSNEVPRVTSTRSRSTKVDKNLNAEIVEVLKRGRCVAEEEVVAQTRKKARNSQVMLVSPKTRSLTRGRKVRKGKQIGEKVTVPLEENFTKRKARSRNNKGPIKDEEVVEIPTVKRSRRCPAKTALLVAEAESTVTAKKSRACKQVQAASPISRPMRRGRPKK